MPLSESPVNAKVRIARIVDQDAPFLQFLDRAGLKPGTTITLSSRDKNADSISVKPDSRAQLTLGTAAANKILVEASD
jgi:Fe2+ transport system protein FeoA